MFDLDSAIKTALKAKDTDTLSAYRSLKAKVMMVLTEKGRDGKPLTEPEFLAQVKREVKEREESNEYLKEGSPEKNQNKNIITILEKHLPKMLSEEEAETLIQTVIAEINPAGPQDMGKIMGALKAKNAPLDMGKASARIKTLLAK